MFGLHNEHRIFFSRVLALDLLVLNGQWDPRLQQVVNAGLQSVIAVLLQTMLWRGLDTGLRRQQPRDPGGKQPPGLSPPPNVISDPCPGQCSADGNRSYGQRQPERER